MGIYLNFFFLLILFHSWKKIISTWDVHISFSPCMKLELTLGMDELFQEN